MVWSLGLLLTGLGTAAALAAPPCLSGRRNGQGSVVSAHRHAPTDGPGPSRRAPAPSLPRGSLPRRRLLAGLAVAAAAPLAATAAAPSMSKDVAALVADVPVYVVTDGDRPYITGRGELGYFFVEKRDAEALLPTVRQDIDPKAVVTTLSLADAMGILGMSREELGGRFQFAAARRQVVHANGLAGRDLDLPKNGDVPLFYDARLSVKGQAPVFFQLEVSSGEAAGLSATTHTCAAYVTNNFNNFSQRFLRSFIRASDCRQNHANADRRRT